MHRVARVAVGVGVSWFVVACSSPSYDDDSDELSASERSAIESNVAGSMASASSNGGGSTGTRSVGGGGLSLAVQQKTPISGETACPAGGRITQAGNITVTCPDPPNTGDCSVTGTIVVRYGDVSNNLNACRFSSGLVIDGGLNMTISGKGSIIDVGMNGTLQLARKGPTNGLIPLRSCFIGLVARGATRTITGSVCGHSVNRRY